MKIHHYKNSWNAFETEVISPEIHELKQKGQWRELAEKIVSEWSVLPDTQKKLHLDILKETLRHLDPVADDALFLQISQYCIAGSDIDKLLADSAEFKAMRHFSGMDEMENISAQPGSGPFALTGKMLQTEKITDADKDRILSAIPESEGKKLLVYRWKKEGYGECFPQKYAERQRTLFAPSVKKNSEIELLQWTLDQSGALPKEFQEMRFTNTEHPEDSLIFFEPMGNFQALLTFLGCNADKFPAFCFLNYFLYAWTYTPDLLDCGSLEHECSSEFMKSVVKSIAFADAAAKQKLEAMIETEPEAGTALYALDLLNGGKPEKNSLLKAAARGSSVAAFFLVRDFAEKNPKINELAKRSILSDEYCVESGEKMQKPFIGCKYEDSVAEIREKIQNLLAADELNAMKALWTRFAAENRNPEKLADLYQVLYLLAIKQNDRPEDAMIRAAVAGNLDAMIDWYEFVRKSGWIVYQKRIREVIRGFYKLTPYQKVRLDLLKLVKA